MNSKKSNNLILIMTQMLDLCWKETALFFFLMLSLFGSYGQSSFQLSAAVGISQEQFNWFIAGNVKGKNPNILSELEWKKLVAVGYKLEVQCPIYKRFYTTARYSQRLVVNGQVTDADYASDDRMNQVFLAQEKANESEGLEGGLLMYYHLVKSSRIHFAIGGGYGMQRQKLRLINTDIGLNSTYTARWYGTEFSSVLSWKLNDDIKLGFNFLYHQVKYKAVGNWNLIEEFQHPDSFSHRAKGFGLTYQLSLDYSLSTYINLFFNAMNDYWKTGAGIDHLYLSDGTVAATKLNQVNRSSIFFSVGARLNLFK